MVDVLIIKSPGSELDEDLELCCSTFKISFEKGFEDHPSKNLIEKILIHSQLETDGKCLFLFSLWLKMDGREPLRYHLSYISRKGASVEIAKAVADGYLQDFLDFSDDYGKGITEDPDYETPPIRRLMAQNVK